MMLTNAQVKTRVEAAFDLTFDLTGWCPPHFILTRPGKV
jgi:hypothetical protein